VEEGKLTEKAKASTGEETILKRLAKMLQNTAEVYDRLARNDTTWMVAYWSGAADSTRQTAQRVRDMIAGKSLTPTVERAALRDMMRTVSETWRENDH